MDSIHKMYGLLLVISLWTVTTDGATDVTLSNVIIDRGGKSFHIECNFTQFVETLEKNNPNAQIKYHIRFLADKTPLVDRDLTITDVTVGKAFLAYDAGIDKNMNKDYRCEVTGEVTGSKKTATSTSEKKFLGIRAETNQLNITEGDIKNLTIVSTVPILCERSFGKCCLQLDLQIGSSVNQLSTFTKCFYEICSDDWNQTLSAATINIPVVANADSIRDGNKDVRIKFRPLIPSGGGQVKQVFENVKIPSVPVKVIDAPEGICSIGGDPHIQRFSKSWLHFQEVGDFVYYENKQQDFDIHIRTWPCGRPHQFITCVSGILIHDGNDILRLSIADGIPLPPNANRLNSQLLLHYLQRHQHLTFATDHKNLPDGTTVDQDHQFVVVKTPSGAKVIIHHLHNSLDMVLKLPPNFMHDPHQNGLCGKYGNANHGLMDRHGHLQSCVRWRPQFPGCRNRVYTDSWKLDRSNSLFYNPPQTKPNRETDKTLYCACAENQNRTSTPLINCTGDGNKTPIQKGCPLCTNVNGGLQKGIYGGTFGKRDAGNGSQTASYDPFAFMAENPTFAGPDHFPNITHDELDKIERKCQQALDQAVFKTQCANLTSIHDDYLNLCVDDAVLTGGDDMFTENAVVGYNQMCLVELEQDPNNYITKPDGTMVIKDDIKNLCSQRCHLHGTCDKGICTCDSGWSGSGCDIADNSTGQANASTTPSGLQTMPLANNPQTTPSSSSQNSQTTLSSTQNSHNTTPSSTQNSQQSTKSSTQNSQQTTKSSTQNSQQTTKSSTQNSQQTTPSSTQNSQQTTKSSTQNSPQTTKSSTQNSQQTTPSSTQNSQQTTKSSTQNSQQTTKSSTQNSQQTTKSSTQNSPQTTPSSTQNSPQTTKSSTQNSQQTTPSSTQNSPQTTKSSTQNSQQTTKPSTQNSQQTTKSSTQNSQQTTPSSTQNSQQTTKSSTQNSQQTTKPSTQNSQQTTPSKHNPQTTKTTPPSSHSHNHSPTIIMINATSYKQDNTWLNGDSCDVSKGHCRSLEISIEKFRDRPALTCTWQELQSVHNDTVISTKNTFGEVWTAHSVRCHVPNVNVGADVGAPYKVFKVSLMRRHQIISDHPVRATIYDSNCVNVANGSIADSGKSCIIDKYCHSDGSHNAVVVGERCVVSKSPNSWSKIPDAPINADLQKLKVVGPDGALSVKCLVGQHSRRTVVDWYANDHKVTSQNVDPGHTVTSISLFKIWGSGPPVSIQCRMKSDPPANVEYISDKLVIA